MIRKTIYFIILLCSFSAESRWINIDDAPVEYHFNNIDITVNSDGTSEAIHEIKFKILNEQGRNNYASFNLMYNENTSKVNIISAYTIYQNKKHHVDLKTIEDKTLASSNYGFDDIRQIIISFPKSEIGTELYIKYAKSENKTMLPNFYNNILNFGYGGCWNNSQININSKTPLSIEVNDPYNSLSVNQHKKDKLYNIKIDLNKQLCSEVIYSTETGTINENKYTWVALSSINSWHDFAKKISVKYEEVINQPLPKLFEPILNKSKFIKDPVEQINFITSSINEKIRYMGDWSSIDGAFFPRNLNIVANLQEADCKEFTSLTANILQRLGYKAQPALVNRSSRELSLAKEIPGMWFNHVFLKVTDKNGKIYWIDPTNSVSMAQGIFPDISDKYILILDSNATSYEKTSSMNPSMSTVVLNDTLRIHNMKINHTGELILTGERALPYIEYGLFSSEKTIKDNIYNLLSQENLKDEEKINITLPALKSRIVKDLDIKFEYNTDSQLTKTNLGQALNITAHGIYRMINYIPGQLSDLYIGPNRTIKKSMTIKNFKAEKIENLNYEIESRWLNFKRTCKVLNGDSIIEDVIVIKESFIENKDLSSEEYKKFKTDIEANISDVAIILN